MRWRDISIFYKLLLSFLVLIVVSAMCLGYTYWRIGVIEKTAENVFDSSNYQETLLRAESAHLQWTNRLANYLARGGTGTLDIQINDTLCGFGKWLYGDGRKTLESAFPEVAIMLKSIEEPHKQLHTSANTISKAIAEGTLPFAVTQYEDVSLKALANVQATLSIIIQSIADTSNKQEKSFITFVDAARLQLLLVILFTAIGGITLALLTARSISHPLHSVMRYAQDVASGNLHKPTMDQKDEIGQLSVFVGIMVGTLSKTIAEAHNKAEEAEQKESEAHEARDNAEAAIVRVQAQQKELYNATVYLQEVVTVLSATTGRITVQVEQSARGVSSQAKRIQDASVAVEELSGSIVEVSRNASLAAEFSGNTRSQAEEGTVLMQQTLHSIQEVQLHSQVLKNDMHVLTDHAHNIDQIMTVISDIADQTNLLALNAAIEAARAGDAGRGFAVVADEVRKLAEKTMASTTNVSSTIAAIQHSAEKNMLQVDKNFSIIEKATALAQKANAVLDSIKHMVGSTADQAHIIAHASEEGADASAEISSNISAVSTIATETAAAMQETSNAVEELVHQCQELTRLISRLEKAQKA